MNNYTVDLKHEIKGRDNRQNQRGGKQGGQQNGRANGGPSKQKERKVEYFAVQVPPTRVRSTLDTTFQDAAPETARMYNMLKQQRRVQSEFHVTLIHRAAAQQHAEYWASLTSIHAQASAPTEQRDYVDPEPKLGLCNVRLERLVWDGRVMAFVVRLIPAEGSAEQWRSVNATAHITVGTAAPEIKPVESNTLLARWLQEGSGAANGISELAVKGVVELEGVVKTVAQKH